MFEESLKYYTKRTLRLDSVSLMESKENSVPLRYTITVGPEGAKSNTRMELAPENYAALVLLIKEMER